MTIRTEKRTSSISKEKKNIDVRRYVYFVYINNFLILFFIIFRNNIVLTLIIILTSHM